MRQLRRDLPSILLSARHGANMNVTLNVRISRLELGTINATICCDASQTLRVLQHFLFQKKKNKNIYEYIQ